MPLNIVRNDITKMHTDAIVAAEGNNLASHGLVGSAIANAAGEKYQKACEELGYCDTGDAKITAGFDLPAKYVIHAVGPRYINGHKGEKLLLQSAYEKSLQLAKENNCESVAFPVIATGGYGFPKDEGLKVATDTIKAFLQENEMDIYLVTFDDETTFLSQELNLEIEDYLGNNYEGAYRPCSELYNLSPDAFGSGEPLTCGNVAAACNNKAPEIGYKKSKASIARTLEGALKIRDESFQQMLFRLIVEKDMKNSEVYTRANLSKSHFSKIKNNPDYRPKKETVFALAIALKLDIDETKELMLKAGYAISHSFMLDTIVEYFIVNKRYDITKINFALFDYDQPLLGEKAL